MSPLTPLTTLLHLTPVVLPIHIDSAMDPWATVKVWKIEPERIDAPLKLLLPALDSAERKRARSKRTEQSRRAYAVAHVCLREIIAAETGNDPGKILFAPRRPSAGKPALANSAPHSLTFNLSHTQGLIVIAVARRREVGVDVEWLGRAVRPTSLSRRYFCKSERTELARIPSDTRAACFLRLWTRREAHAKMIGEGLSRAVASGTGVDGPFGGMESRILELGLTPGHVGAIAVQAHA